MWRVRKFLIIKKYNDSGYFINNINKSSCDHISKPNSLPLAATRYCSTHQNKFVSGTLASENLFDIAIKNLNSHLHILCCVFKWSFIVISCKSHLRIMAACFNWKEHIIRETVIHVDHYYTRLQKKGRAVKGMMYKRLIKSIWYS